MASEDLSPRKLERQENFEYQMPESSPKTGRMKIREKQNRRKSSRSPVGHTMSDGSTALSGGSVRRHKVGKSVGFELLPIDRDKSPSPGASDDNAENLDTKSTTAATPHEHSAKKKHREFSLNYDNPRDLERAQAREEKKWRSAEISGWPGRLDKDFRKLHVSSPGRYRSLRVFHQDSQDEADSNTSGMSTPGRSDAKDEERYSFHKTFQMLIRIGNDKKPMHDIELSKVFSMRGRRGSQLMWPMGREKHDLGEVLWLHLRTFLSGRPMSKAEIVNSTKQYDEWLLRQRDSMLPILKKIREYRFSEPWPSYCSHNSVNGSPAEMPFWSPTEEHEEVPDTPLCNPSARSRRKSSPHFDLEDVSPKGSNSSLVASYLNVPPDPVAEPGQREIFCGAFLQRQRKAVVEVAQLLKGWPLRLRGMRKVLQRMGEIAEKTLAKARKALQRPAGTIGVDTSGANKAHHKRSFFIKENDPELTKYGLWNEGFKSTFLPSFYPSFLFLLRVPLDLVHEWLKLRVEDPLTQRQGKEPDPLTLRTLMQDCHDCLEGAVEVKCFYQDYVQATTYGEDQLDKLLVKDLQDFELDLGEMFKIYLNYVRCWGELQAKYESRLSEWSQYLLTKLEEEWKFAKKIAINVLSGESDAALKFCQLGNLMFDEMVENYLVSSCETLYEEEEEEEEPINILSSDTSSPCPSLEKFSSDESAVLLENKQHSTVFLACRSFKAIISEVRERALRSLTFAKLLRSDLEISVKFERECTQAMLLEQLLDNNYVLVTTPHSIEDFMMFCEKQVAENEEHLQLLLNVTCGRDDNEVPHELAGKPGYLLLVKCEEKRDKRDWKGSRKHIVPDADTDMALHFMQVDAVYLVVVNSASLKSQREAMEVYIPSDYLRLVDDQCSCHAIIAENMNELKEKALGLRDKIASQLQKMSDDLLQERDDTRELDENELQTYRDTLIQAYNFAFEYHIELKKLISAQFRPRLAHGLKDFVKQWTDFVQSTCSKGHGVRPRWAYEGLNFLALSTSPEFTLCLNDNDFDELKNDINRSIAHVIGHAPFVHSERSRDGFFFGSETPSAGVDNIWRFPPTHSEPAGNSNVVPRGVSHSTSSGSGSQSAGARQSLPVFPSLRPNCVDTVLHSRSRSGSDSRPQSVSAESSFMELANPIARIRARLHKDEQKRQKELLNAKRIGKCLDQSNVPATAPIDGKKAAFRWQRLDKKLGEGRFGVVYTAINLETTKLMAVKQIKFQRQDHRAMRALIDEVKNFESIHHPNLVSYYGVEVHRDELLIFMEYCDEGTLKNICRDVLDEIYVRQYTHYLLRGIHYLHDKRIVHRDIKPCNIFMTSSKEVLKLGDFGCSIRLKNSTTQRGELTGHVGTAAFMAPEVITGGRYEEEGMMTRGYGREADIWSLGCVVLEMATGKEPWHDFRYEQIIWKVGNGQPPKIPECLSSNCKNFLSHCFEARPEKRWTAARLIEDSFAKVIGHEDSLTGSE